MLGSMVTDQLSREPEFEVSATTRNKALEQSCRERLDDVTWLGFDAESASFSSGASRLFAEFDWIVNCIGIIKPLIRDDNAREVEQAARINSIFPHLLARWTEKTGARVLQIATDCVYSGNMGHYTESDQHDALDVYGKTKSLGEVYAQHVHHLRCSIVGPEMKDPKSLMEWFLAQPRDAVVNGFVNHNWNGVTTLHFARLCEGIMREGINLSHAQHVVPADEVSKYELLGYFARSYNRDDVTVKPTAAATVIDRTLRTNDERLNRELWAAAGYQEPPVVRQMIDELARFVYRPKAESAYAGN